MSHLETFRREFKIAHDADLGNVAVAVDAVYSAASLFTEFLQNVESPDNAFGFRIYSFLNMLGRTCEHAQGMLVAMATGSATSAEALGRIVVESSINLMFLATKGDPATLVKFYQTWLEEHRKRLADWEKLVQEEAPNSGILGMIAERRQAVSNLSDFLDANVAQCPIDMSSPAPWPGQIRQRFQQVGREGAYFTTYHRLSGSSHVTGEDTLMWFLSLNGTPEMREKLGHEAWAYSVMMTLAVCQFFIDAVSACCEDAGMPPNAELRAHRQALDAAIFEIAPAAGVPMHAMK